VLRELEDYVVNSVQDVQEAVNDCAANGLCLKTVGGGTQQHIGYPGSPDAQTLSTTSLNNIIEYQPDDLVVVAESGMTLSALQSTLSRYGQWLPIDVAAPNKQTLGGIVATRSNSLLRAGYGSVRDWLIGVEVVNGDGDVVVGGGKVVKNVSGYDLPKLYCGSWGTLGLLTRTNFKVAPLPEADRSLLIVLSADRNSEELIDVLLETVNPSSLLLFNATAAQRVLGETAAVAQYLTVRFLGVREAVDVQIERASAASTPFAASVIDLPQALAACLSRLLADFSLLEAQLSAKYHILSSQVGAYARMVEWIANRFGLTAEVVSDAACGIVNAHFHSGSADIDWVGFYTVFKDKADRVGGSLIVERMPLEWRSAGVEVWSPILPDHKIMRMIKSQLDPNGIFNPGCFMGGI
jgi:glycolate oxidase FAD binding subunit